MKIVRVAGWALLAVSGIVFGKGETERITLTQSGRAVTIADPAVVGRFAFGPGPGNSDWQPRSWIVEDWEHPVSEPSQKLLRQQATFHLRMHDATTRDYAVVFVHDPESGAGYVHLPGRGEPFYDSNVYLMLRGDKYDGHWFRATSEWTRLVLDSLGGERVK